jgi:hypothetical protein
MVVHCRFLRVYRAGTGAYTRDRHEWLKGLTVQELAQEFEGRQASFNSVRVSVFHTFAV